MEGSRVKPSSPPIATQILSQPGFTWLDLVSPSKEHLEETARRFSLHRSSVEDCLAPSHLPKFEKIGPVSFAILRAFDESCGHSADTVQELTNKLAVFIGVDFLLTVRRVEQPYFQLVAEKWKELAPAPSAESSRRIASDLAHAVIGSYGRPIERELAELDRFEAGIFSVEGAKALSIEEGYYIKRRASVFRRIFQLTREVVNKMAANLVIDDQAPETQRIRDELGSHIFYADEILESMHYLLNLHISMSSQKTNEVMRILTVFSLIFLPLNLIAGIYGMNFERMPELKWEHGYAGALLLMVITASGVMIWFRNRGWLKY